MPAALFLTIFRNCRLIYDAHEYYAGLEIFNRRKIRKKIWMIIEAMAIPRVDVLITVSEPLAELYRQKYARLKKAIVIRNLPLFKSSAGSESLPLDLPRIKDPVIVYQGHFRPGRGLLNLLHAFIQTKNLHLLLIGGGELENELKKIVKANNLENRVTFLGYIPTNDLIHVTSRADLGVALFEPSSINYKYALPNKFFEYIMAGIPVLASNIATFKYYIEKYKVGMTVEPADLNKITRLLMQMVQDKDKLAEWQANTRKAAQQLNWESEFRLLKQIYENLKK
jgi:glycosyltransferase involved in cell wall biosynthesis